MIVYRDRRIASADLAPPAPEPAPAAPPERFVTIPASLLERAIGVLASFSDAAGDIALIGLEDDQKAHAPLPVRAYRAARAIRRELMGVRVDGRRPPEARAPERLGREG